MQYILNDNGSVSVNTKKKKKNNTEQKKEYNNAVKNFVDAVKNTNVKRNGFSTSRAITDLANIYDTGMDMAEKTPLVGNYFKFSNKARKTAGNIVTNMGEGAIKSTEGIADTLSDVYFNPQERFRNYVSDYIKGGKEYADENLKDLKEQQKQDIQRNLTQEFMNKIGYNDVVDDFEKDSLVKRENLGGQVAQGIGGMVPFLVLGQAYGGTPNLTDLKDLTGKEKALAALGNVGRTYAAQMPANLALGAQSYGRGMEEALNEGATMNQARKFGLANAAIEQGTEMLTGGVPGLEGRGGIDQFVDPLIGKTGGYLNPLLKAGYGALGEGLEEYTSEMLNPIAKKIYSDEPIDWDETRKRARQAGLVGGITGAFLNTPSNIQNFQEARANNQIKNQQKVAQQEQQTKQKTIQPQENIKEQQVAQETIQQEQPNQTTSKDTYGLTEKETNEISRRYKNILEETGFDTDYFNENATPEEMVGTLKTIKDFYEGDDGFIGQSRFESNKVRQNTRNQYNKINRFINRFEGKISQSNQNTKVEQNNVTEQIQEPLIKTKEFADAKEKVANGTATEKERSYIKTATEAQNTEEITKQMEETAKTYEVQANEKTLMQAEAKLKGKATLEEKANYVNAILQSDKRLNASDMAAAELVLKDAAAAKNTKLYNEVLENIATYATEQGQSIQALSMIRKLSPTSQLDVLEKIINREKSKGNKAYQNVEVTEEMKNKIFDCYDENGKINQEKFDNTMEEIKQELAKNIKTSVAGKIRAWRYLSMLGNPKTHARNVVSNVAMGVVKLAEDIESGVAQDIFVKNKSDKTKTLKRASQDVKNYTNEVYKQIEENTIGNKYNEQSDLENRATVFKNRFLEAVRKFNDKALSAEDQYFKRATFKRAFSNYLTAQGISTEADIKANPQVVERAKLFAVEEANVATFNQENKLAQFINSGDTKLGTPYKVIRGAILPFTRTPLNIAKAGIERTPLVGLAPLAVEVNKAPSNMKANVLIDGLSKQITGSALAMVGYALAKSGRLTAKTDDDKEGKFEKDQGSTMDYSIKIGNKSYDLSWLSPSAMPFFVGARMFEVLDKQEGINENIILESLATTLDPLSEMSCLDSFTKVLQSYKKNGAGMLSDMAISTGQNYLSQFIPTISGQFARIFDDKKRNTYADSSAPNKISQETYRQLAYKIPGLRNTLPESADYFGNTKKEDENAFVRAFNSLINPTNIKQDTMTPESKELIRLYEKTGNDDIIPSALKSSVKFNGNDYSMTARQYNEYKKTFGTAFEKNLKTLMNTDEYKNASDDEKAEMIAGIMSYSKDKTKDNFLTIKGEDYEKTLKDGSNSPYESDKVDMLTNDNFSIADYYIYKAYTPNIVNGKYKDVRNRLNFINTFGIDYEKYSKYMEEIGKIKGDNRKQRVFEYINSLDLTAEQKKLLMKKEYPSYRNFDREFFNIINDSDLTLEEKENLKNFLKIGK